MASTEGKAAGEFPLLYWANAQLWKIFGQSELGYRMLNMLIALIGFYALFRISYRLNEDALVSIVAPLVLYSSALFPYYSWNFLPNIPALSLAFLSVWQLLQWQDKSKWSYLLLAVAFAALAGLMKASSLIAPLAAFATIFLFKLKDRKTILRILSGIGLITLSLFLWYSYAKNYNVNYSSNAFILDFVPIWQMSAVEVNEVINMFDQHWRSHFYSEPAYFFFFSLLILNFLILVIRQKWMALSFYLLCLGGSLAYILLFFRNLGIHDYYLIELFLIPAILVILFFYSIKDWSFKWLKPVSIILFAIFIYSEAGHARDKMRARFGDFYNYHYLTYYQDLTGLDSEMIDLGIKKDDLIISIPDDSPNITLYLLHRRGWSNYGNKNKSLEDIQKHIKKGAKYLIINDPQLLQVNYIQPFLKDPLLRKGKVSIYKL